MTTKNLSNNHQISKICSVPLCSKNNHARNLCHTHYVAEQKKGSFLIPKYNLGKGRTFEERFWSRVKKDANEKGCWEWQASKVGGGYGHIYFQRRNELTHRIAWFLAYGVLPTKCLLHSCDNPSCVNIAHLREGTLQENIADMVGKNRQIKGETQWCSKLRESQIKTIRDAVKNGATYVSQAQKYKVYPTTIKRICSRITWKHID